jgi:hypothetical protein
MRIDDWNEYLTGDVKISDHVVESLYNGAVVSMEAWRSREFTGNGRRYLTI